MSKSSIGSTTWFVPDGFIPAESSGKLESHESICFLNCNSEDANANITIYFEDQEPIENIVTEVKGNRTKHLRTDLLEKEGKKIPKGVPYAIKIETDLPVIVQFSRMDTTQAENTLMTSMAYPGS